MRRRGSVRERMPKPWTCTPSAFSTTTPSSTGMQSRSEQQAASYQECARALSSEQIDRATRKQNANSRALPGMAASASPVVANALQDACHGVQSFFAILVRRRDRAGVEVG